MNENDNLGCLYSWPTIIVALIFFWPIGLVLLIKRISLDKKATMSSGKFIGGIGIGCYAIAALVLIACFDSGFDGGSFVAILFFGVAGYALRRVAKKTRKDAENVKQYLSMIVNGNVRQLDVIASSTGKSYETVKSDIQKMIDRGFLKNAYVNEGIREVVLATDRGVKNVTNSSNTSAVQTRVVTCPCCGANNTISSKIGECEYCGSPLE